MSDKTLVDCLLAWRKSYAQADCIVMIDSRSMWHVKMEPMRWIYNVVHVRLLVMKCVVVVDFINDYSPDSNHHFAAIS